MEKLIKEARRLREECNFSDAVSVYDNLTRQHRCNAWVWYEYCLAAAGSQQLDLLDYASRKASELEPDNSDLLLQIGHVYNSLRLPQKAKTLFERAAELAPRSVNPRMALAIYLERNHRIAEARDAIASCFTIDGRDEQARYFSALLDWREHRIDEAERGLCDLIASEPRHQYVQYASRYLLADIFNHTGRFDKAMEMLSEAKKLVSALTDANMLLELYDKQAQRDRRNAQSLPANILRIWRREFPEKRRKPIPKLAFLGGHPRSGTTLIEGVLGAHPNVTALDEPETFARLVTEFFYTPLQFTPAKLNVIRRRYFQGIYTELGGDAKGKLIVDKNPSGTGVLYIWLRIFPELRTIIALRDPRDVVISCYFQNIPLNFVNANFLSLERAAVHYANLMDILADRATMEEF